MLVITDGVDNESRESLESAIRKVLDDQGPIIYTIGILGDEPGIKRAKRALQSLSDQTGGVAFFPKDLAEVDEISSEVARDIRNQYSITYKPTNPRANGGYRKVRVEARAQGYKDCRPGPATAIMPTKSGQPQNSKELEFAKAGALSWGACFILALI